MPTKEFLTVQSAKTVPYSLLGNAVKAWLCCIWDTRGRRRRHPGKNLFQSCGSPFLILSVEPVFWYLFFQSQFSQFLRIACQSSSHQRCTVRISSEGEWSLTPQQRCWFWSRQPLLLSYQSSAYPDSMAWLFRSKNLAPTLSHFGERISIPS